MDINNTYFGFPLASSPAGHASWQGTTAIPEDVLLTQASRGPTQFDWTPDNVAASHDFVGHPVVNDILPEISQCYPPVWPSQPMSQPLSLSNDINDDSTRSFTGAMRPVRKVQAGDTVSSTCQWQFLDSSICGQQITSVTVPRHLAGHGIRNMRRDWMAQCCWRECGTLIKRQGITRHFREVHLGLKRKSYARASCSFCEP